MPFRSVYLVNGKPEFSSLYVFTDAAAYGRWWTEVTWLKHESANIALALANQNRAGQGGIADYRNWLDRAYAFLDQWGADYVPLDIRHALNTIEQGCSIAVTYWPVEESH